MKNIHNLIFVENELSSLLIAILIRFDQYEDSSFIISEKYRVIPISPIKCTWKSKIKTVCSCI